MVSLLLKYHSTLNHLKIKSFLYNQNDLIFYEQNKIKSLFFANWFKLNKHSILKRFIKEMKKFNLTKVDFDYTYDSFKKMWQVVKDNSVLTCKSELELLLENRLLYKNKHALLKQVNKQDIILDKFPKYYSTLYTESTNAELDTYSQSLAYGLGLYLIKCLQKNNYCSRIKFPFTQNSNTYYYYSFVVEVNHGYMDMLNRVASELVDSIEQESDTSSFEYFDDLNRRY